MADPAAPTPNSPTPAEPSLETEIMEALSLTGDTSSEADAIANRGGDSTPEPKAADTPVSPPKAGEALDAPLASPVTPEPAAADPATATPSAGQTPAPSDAPALTPAAPQAVNEDALRRASLEATVNALQAEITQLRANQQPQGQQAQPAAADSSGQPTAPQPFRYALTLPKPVQDAINSGEPEQVTAAIGSIVNDLGTIVHNTVLAQVRSEVSHVAQPRPAVRRVPVPSNCHPERSH